MTDEKKILEDALALVGSRKALCEVLWLSYEELDAYLKEEKPVPPSILAAAADLVKRRKPPV